MRYTKKSIIECRNRLINVFQFYPKNCYSRNFAEECVRIYNRILSAKSNESLDDEKRETILLNKKRKKFKDIEELLILRARYMKQLSNHLEAGRNRLVSKLEHVLRLVDYYLFVLSNKLYELEQEVNSLLCESISRYLKLKRSC